MLRIPTQAFWWFCFGLYAVGACLGYSLGITSELTPRQAWPLAMGLLVLAAVILGVAFRKAEKGE